MTSLFSKFLSDEKGATAVEYALAAAILAVGLIPAFDGLRTMVAGIVDAVGINLLWSP